MYYDTHSINGSLSSQCYVQMYIRSYRFTVSIDSQRGGNSIVPLYYLCCERRLAPSMLYITLVIITIIIVMGYE